MPASNFNLRNLTPQLMSKLRQEAVEHKISINSLILQIIEQGLGLAHPTKKMIYHDLDYLAGTWGEEDIKTFNDKIKSFEKIDEDLWL